MAMMSVAEAKRRLRAFADERQASSPLGGRFTQTALAVAGGAFASRLLLGNRRGGPVRRAGKLLIAGKLLMPLIPVVLSGGRRLTHVAR